MIFPYGIADFYAVRMENYFYIDRTDRISLIEETGKHLLFLRPRRFGKSLLLSMLKNYYDLALADIFNALYITEYILAKLTTQLQKINLRRNNCKPAALFLK